MALVIVLVWVELGVELAWVFLLMGGVKPNPAENQTYYTTYVSKTEYATEPIPEPKTETKNRPENRTDGWVSKTRRGLYFS